MCSVHVSFGYCLDIPTRKLSLHHSQLYSEMFVASLILAVAVTTARVRTDNNFNISSGCLVRRGRCDTTELTEWERAAPTKIDSRNLQHCAFACKVQSTEYNWIDQYHSNVELICQVFGPLPGYKC